MEVPGNQKDHPGIYFPPPLLYVAVFVAAIYIQKIIPIRKIFFQTSTSLIIGLIIILLGIFFAFPALYRFVLTKNTVITNKPANSLQTEGIYSHSRNPMYVGLCCLYLGLSLLFGNWWHLILFPILILLVYALIIRREENYLTRRFGDEYKQYRSKVRRWL